MVTRTDTGTLRERLDASEWAIRPDHFGWGDTGAAYVEHPEPRFPGGWAIYGFGANPAEVDWLLCRAEADGVETRLRRSFRLSARVPGLVVSVRWHVWETSREAAQTRFEAELERRYPRGSEIVCVW